MPGTSGGVADKLGNKYELACAIQYALYCIQDERRSLTLEDIDPDLAYGSEFTYVDENSDTWITQIKRQNNTRDHWSVPDLSDRRVFDAAFHHVAAGRKYRFTSTTPSGKLRDMAERARQSATVQEFVSNLLTKELQPTFNSLTAPNALKSTASAWQTLRGMWFEVEAEDQVVKHNAALASALLEGATGDRMGNALRDVLLNNLRKRMTKHELLEALARVEIDPLGMRTRQTSLEQVKKTTHRWRASIKRELLEPQIERQETTKLLKLMTDTRIALVVGDGGGGKSAVLYQAARELEKENVEVLAFRLDRMESFTSPETLGKQLGIDHTPATALRMAADGRDSVLIIDQLDAVSLASGRLSERYDVIADVIEEATALDGMRVVLACRSFDVDNDHRIRGLSSQGDVKRFAIGPLTDKIVTTAVSAMGLNASLLTGVQRDLLQSPLNLVLLKAIADRPTALSFTTRESLFKEYWNRKQQTAEQRKPGTRFNDVLARIANYASDHQTLSVPIEVLDADDYVKDAHVLASEHVITIENGRVSFFHETFFDYTFARQWLFREQSLVEFLCAQEQQLFRRAQVRQILQMLREGDLNRFRDEIESVLTSDSIRFHIKETVVAVLAAISTPTPEDVDFVLRLGAHDSPIMKRLWLQLAQPAWFKEFHTRGQIALWLDSDDAEKRSQGLLWMRNAVPENSVEVAELLKERRHSPDYVWWLLYVTLRAKLHHCRPLFDLLLATVRAGKISPTDNNLWLSTHDLVNHQPLWAIELLKGCFIESPRSLVLTSDDKVDILTAQIYWASETIAAASKAKPKAFAETFVPYLLDVMQATSSARPGQDLLYDRHFGYRIAGEHFNDDLGDALYDAASNAFSQWAKTSPNAVKPLLLRLADSKQHAAQVLLYRALIAGADSFAPWAAELLLQGGNRLKVGYISDAHWLSRELVNAISPIVDDETHRKLEDAFRDLPATYQGPDLRDRLRWFGYTAFKFLSALDPTRLTPPGCRRLQEYQRKFGQDSPEAPAGIVSHKVSSPIGSTATRRMSDAQWLRAIAKHNKAERDSSWEVGGARELAGHLQARTTEDPLRFAKFAMQMTSETNPSYLVALLSGFGEVSWPKETQQSLFEAVRHIGGLGLPDCDRWLGYSVRKVLEDTPLDIVEMILDRILHASDPVDDSHLFIREGSEQTGQDLFQNGINTSRGSLALLLGDLLVHDVDGSRTASVAPHLAKLATDPTLSFRTCVARTIAACLRHERQLAYKAFQCLIDADDILLAAPSVEELMMYIGNADPGVIDPVINRMLISASAEVQRAGGRTAAFAALHWNRPALIKQALAGDVEIRRGLVTGCATSIGRSSDSELALSTLKKLMPDEDDEVRKEFASLATELRRIDISPYTDFLVYFINSPSYVYATHQLLIALQGTPSRVDDLVVLAAHRFLDENAAEVADIRTGAAADAHYLSDLVVRGLAQARGRAHVKELLDVLDRLLELGAEGIHEAINKAERR